MAQTAYAQNDTSRINYPSTYFRKKFAGANSSVIIIPAQGLKTFIRVFSVTVTRGSLTEAASVDPGNGTSEPVVYVFGGSTNPDGIIISTIVDLAENESLKVTNGAAGMFIQIGYSVLNLQ